MDFFSYLSLSLYLRRSKWLNVNDTDLKSVTHIYVLVIFYWSK